MPSPFVIRKELATAAAGLARHEFFPGGAGAMSVRLDADHILLTAEGVDPEQLSPDSILTVTLGGRLVQGQGHPGYLWYLHRYLYERRPELEAVMHGWPPYSCASCVAGIAPDQSLLPTLFDARSKIAFVDQLPLSPDSAATAMDALVENHEIFLVRNFGLLIAGRSLSEVVRRATLVEHLAKVTYLARQMGRTEGIPSDGFKRLELMRKAIDGQWEKNRRRSSHE